MTDYLKSIVTAHPPRLPLDGSIDLTYRCNNNCCHCWLRIPAASKEKREELTFKEIMYLVDEARKMGCRRWSISGGEPMLRPDFPEIFDYITSNCISYTLNTNGALITPEIARLMRRKGSKLVALYGATSDVHDHITRNPGSFEATMRGFARLKEAGAGFTVQLIPMTDNYHQFGEMVQLAESLSSHWRIGAAWLYLSAEGDPEKNREILRQRLDPAEVIRLDQPDLSYEEWMANKEDHRYCHIGRDDRLFASCIDARRDFHIDPYGQMTFCGYIKDPALLYDLRKGSFKECWEEFIPSLADKVRGGSEYLENCASCELRGDCRWCPVYGYLEHRRFSAKVEYLCAAARENRRFKRDWQKNHRRYYRIAGITIGVESDLPLTDNTFHPKFEIFRVDGPGEDNITIRHHFSLPDLNGSDLGMEVYRKPPWAIYKKGDSWVYVGISPAAADKHIHRVVVFSRDHARARIYNDGEKNFREGGLHSLTLFPSDQILLARVLADRQGCYIHSGGVLMEGQGLLFVGHSEAGKSTIVTMLKDEAEILCDDRMIVRRWPQGFMIHGTWSHGDVPDVSASSAPLNAVMFLEQAKENRLIPIEDRKEINRRLLACLVRPLETSEWWDKMLCLVEAIGRETPCYSLRFDKSGDVVDILREFSRQPAAFSQQQLAVAEKLPT